MGDHRRIRVLLAVTRLELGGAQRVVLHTAATLDRDEFAAGLAWGPGDLLDEEARSIVGLDRFPIPTLVRPVAPVDDPRALWGMRRAIRTFRPDVVHTHSSKAGILGRLAARLEGVPSIVHTVHGFGFTPLQSAPKRRVFEIVERVMARFTDHFVMVSDTDRRRAAEMGLAPLERSRVIRAGIDLGRFRSGVDGSAVRESYGIPAAVPLVTQIGNFKPQKAPLDFVRVAVGVAAAEPAAWFLMIGDGPLRGDAEELARSSGLSDRFIFGGWSDDIPGVLAATTVSVLTSRHEGLPCSVVESLAAGVPMVATAVDGTVEVVRPGENGFLAPAGDVPTLIEGVVALLSDPALRGQFGRAARERLDEFDRDLMVRKQEELYRWIGTTTQS